MTGSHISLFTGIGGFDLVAERLGYPTALTAEVVPFCRELLRLRFPQCNWHMGDVKFVRVGGVPGNFDPDAFARPMLMTGGFPCQGASDAGTARGMGDPRTGLWSEFARLIGEFKPEFVMIENSARLRSRGMHRVLTDLWRHGYDAQWDCIPAASVGAPHLRDRIWIGAIPTHVNRPHPLISQARGYGSGWGFGFRDTEPYTNFERAGRMIDGSIYQWQPAATIRECRADAKRRGMVLLPTPTRADGTGGPGTTPRREGGKNLRTVAHDHEGNGRLDPAFVEWMMGLPPGWTDPDCMRLRTFQGWHPQAMRGRSMTTTHRVPHRSDRIRALGNGLVPQVAHVALMDLFNWSEGRPV